MGMFKHFFYFSGFLPIQPSSCTEDPFLLSYTLACWQSTWRYGPEPELIISKYFNLNLGRQIRQKYRLNGFLELCFYECCHSIENKDLQDQSSPAGCRKGRLGQKLWLGLSYSFRFAQGPAELELTQELKIRNTLLIKKNEK